MLNKGPTRTRYLISRDTISLGAVNLNEHFTDPDIILAAKMHNDEIVQATWRQHVNNAHYYHSPCALLFTTRAFDDRSTRPRMAGRAASMGFLGAGQMATALARGFIRAGMSIMISISHTKISNKCMPILIGSR